MKRKVAESVNLSFDFEEVLVEDFADPVAPDVTATDPPSGSAPGSASGSAVQQGAERDTGGQHGAGEGSERPGGAEAGRQVRQGYGKQSQDAQRYLAGSEVPGGTMFDIDPPKRRNAGYRVRRDLRQEQLIEMPLVITAVELRAGVAEDDRAWNRKFNTLREEFTKEISYLRLVIGDRLKLEVTWQQPINWPICALRAPDGTRIVETDSQQLRGYGVREASLLWRSIVDKQRTLQEMARNYEGLVRCMGKLPDKVGEAMDGARSCRLVLDPELHKQIEALNWPRYHRDTAGGAFSPLPFNVAEAMRVRLWAHAKAVKQHVHAMNLNYNRVTNERRVSLGKTRPAALAVGFEDGPCRTPMHYWALWVRKGQQNLFYRTVTPRVVSATLGKYVTPESFAVSDRMGRVRTEAIDRCHLTHMKEIYRAADHALHELAQLSKRTAGLIVALMGKRHGADSPAVSGRGQWRGSGRYFRWYPGQ